MRPTVGRIYQGGIFLSDHKLFTVGSVTADAGVQSVMVDGCKVTLHYNENSNPAILTEIKTILSSAISNTKSNEKLKK